MTAFPWLWTAQWSNWSPGSPSEFTLCLIPASLGFPSGAQPSGWSPGPALGRSISVPMSTSFSAHLGLQEPGSDQGLQCLDILNELPGELNLQFGCAASRWRCELSGPTIGRRAPCSLPSEVHTCVIHFAKCARSHTWLPKACGILTGVCKQVLSGCAREWVPESSRDVLAGVF